MEHKTDLTDEERVRIALEYEAFTRWVEQRHKVSVEDVIESVRWVKAHRSWVDSMKRGGSLALIGFFASGLLLAIWEGFKMLVKR